MPMNYVQERISDNKDDYLLCKYLYILSAGWISEMILIRRCDSMEYKVMVLVFTLSSGIKDYRDMGFVIIIIGSKWQS